MAKDSFCNSSLIAITDWQEDVDDFTFLNVGSYQHENLQYNYL
jgi:hypothetical protein